VACGTLLTGLWTVVLNIVWTCDFLNAVSELPFFLRSNKMLKLSTRSVQASTAADRLLGPYFLPQLLTGAVDHSFLSNLLPELPKMWIYLWSIHDGAPLHFVLAVRQFLNSVFLAQLVRPGGPRASGLPLFYNLYLMSTVCTTAVTEVQKVKKNEAE
jgi:hypothetical protein